MAHGKPFHREAAPSTEMEDGVKPENGTEVEVKPEDGPRCFQISAKGSTREFHIHAWDASGVPMLLNVKALASLGAVIDFAEEMAIFAALDPDMVVQLERAECGHFMVDLSEDLLSGGRRLAAASAAQGTKAPEDAAG